MKLLLLFAAAILPILSQAQTFYVNVDHDRDSEHEHYYHDWHHHRHHHHGYWQRHRYWDEDRGVWIIRREWVEEEPD